VLDFARQSPDPCPISARQPYWEPKRTMSTTVELDDELMERIRNHLEEDETPAEFIEELVNMYETEGAFLQEGYSE